MLLALALSNRINLFYFKMCGVVILAIKSIIIEYRLPYSTLIFV